MPIKLDHIVIAAPDLNELISRFTRLTGIEAIPGGRHSTGTANALVPLESPAGSYIELIGPDPAATASLAELDAPDNFALRTSAATEPRVAAWCVRPDDLDAYARDNDSPGIEEMSRETPQGEVLNWRLIPAERGVDHAPTPFAIDWLNSAHPSAAALGSGQIVQLRLRGGRIPEGLAPEVLDFLLVEEGEPLIELVLDTPNGVVELKDI